MYYNQWRIQDLWKRRAGNQNAAMPRQAWKSRSTGGGGGGDSDTFFFFSSFTLWGRGTVRLPDRPQGWKAKKKKKALKKEKKKRLAEKSWGRRRFGPPPPPWIRHCLNLGLNQNILWSWFKVSRSKQNHRNYL